MKLEKIAQALRPLSVSGPVDIEIRGMAYDSRQVRQGFLFVALRGEHHDGASFVDDAVSRGALAIVSQRADVYRKETTCIRVADARQAVAEAASLFYGHPSARLQVVGITGTNGKTTAAYLVHEVLAAAKRSPGLIGTVEYRVGNRVIPAGRTTPQAVDLQALLDQMVQAESQSVVMEVSSHSLDQKRVWGIDFDVAVFTNLTHDHLDYHKNMDQYFEAKKLLFTWLGGGGKKACAVINVDDPWGRRLVQAPGTRARVITYGTTGDAGVRAADIQLTGRGSTFRVVTPWGAAAVCLGLLGRYNVSNALAAIAACGALGIDLNLAAQTVGVVRSIPGRLEEIPAGNGVRVFVDYAHTDDALANVLRTLREITGRRLIVVFGCGGNRDSAKRPTMGAVAAELADFSILTSDNPRKESPGSIITQIRQGFEGRSNFEVIEEREAAIRKALSVAGPGDVVLVAGKGHETFQEFANTVIPFDDREVVRRILAETSARATGDAGIGNAPAREMHDSVHEGGNGAMVPR